MKRIKVRGVCCRLALAVGLASCSLMASFAAKAATVQVTTPTDWYVENADGNSTYEINDNTSTMLRAARRSSRQAQSFLWITTYYSGIPTTATITSATLNIFPWIISYSSPYTSSDIEIVGLEPVFGSPHLLPYADGPILGTASFNTSGNMTAIPLDVSFLQDNLEADQLFVLRMQMAHANSEISISSSRHSLETHRPYLEITYQVPEPASCVLLVGTMVGGLLNRRKSFI